MNAAPSSRTRIRRIPELAVYEREVLHGILDAGYLCHLAFQDENGSHCIPMAYWRINDALYIHGSNGSRLMKHLSSGAEVSIAISHLDGLVLARSAFNHSMNYRSVVIYGKFVTVIEAEQKMAALDAFMDKLAPGRKNEVRSGSKQELGATIVLKITLDEAAAKVRSGGAEDDTKDMHIEVWAGVLPFQTLQAKPVPNEDCKVDAPLYVACWQGGKQGQS
ncbi:pyridoxamine 5'-phosphate oxidase family protein [Iodobacter fluviatilis]|uniref:Flavin-nucleotide-binding protein n=1 Tax=Iodobacter fluviatilis TaxID=537 RepID=A0A7G3GCJ3_9NEIS|nr:pyridoxamine 5'-phosphate oxidase family protein [Iodobacter fluviatilis]QBC44762.1 flavin-nucleotide-binding protein [Iodobacter fluviatilis]